MDPQQRERPRVRPGWVTALGIIGVIVGSYGVISGVQLLQGGRLAPEDAERRLRDLVRQMPGMQQQPKGLQDAIDRAVPGAVALEHRWRKRHVALAAADVLLSALLLFGALQGLRLLPSGRWLWLNASWALIPVELLNTALQVAKARQHAHVWIEALERSADVPGSGQELGIFTTAWVGAAVGIFGLKAAALIAYYVITIVRLSRTDARQLFVPPESE